MSSRGRSDLAFPPQSGFRHWGETVVPPKDLSPASVLGSKGSVVGCQAVWEDGG